jgi:DNA-binding CsgD family transcriptional regulator
MRHYFYCFLSAIFYIYFSAGFLSEVGHFIMTGGEYLDEGGMHGHTAQPFFRWETQMFFAFSDRKPKHEFVAALESMGGQSQQNDPVATLLKENRRKSHWILATTITGFLLLLGILSINLYRLNERKKLLEKVQELQLTDKLLIKDELKNQTKELTSNLLKLAAIQELSQVIKSELQEILQNNPSVESKSFSRIFKHLDQQTIHSRWEEFYSRFDELDGDFLKSLTVLHPSLSAAEIRLCVFLRLNLPSKDICTLTNRSLRTIENLRYRIRKKIGLSGDMTLTQYILSI